MQLKSLDKLLSILLSALLEPLGQKTDWNIVWSLVSLITSSLVRPSSPATSRSVSSPQFSSGSRLETMNWPEWMDSLCRRTAIVTCDFVQLTENKDRVSLSLGNCELRSPRVARERKLWPDLGPAHTAVHCWPVRDASSVDKYLVQDHLNVAIKQTGSNNQ